MNINTACLKAFLERISPLISSGFGPFQITQIVELAIRIPVDGEQEFQFPVEYAGQPSTLKVGIYKDDIEEVGLYLFAPHDLAEGLRTEMERHTE